ncbi:hypothetical protein LTR17_013573 [Elasticomyces elasticus]|nr:hypothetical protein LTR17_013573 [Elasticomyces elasticus]
MSRAALLNTQHIGRRQRDREEAEREEAAAGLEEKQEAEQREWDDHEREKRRREAIKAAASKAEAERIKAEQAKADQGENKRRQNNEARKARKRQEADSEKLRKTNGTRRQREAATAALVSQRKVKCAKDAEEAAARNQKKAEIVNRSTKDTRRYFICVKCMVPRANSREHSGVNHDERFWCEMWASNDNFENQIKWCLRGDHLVSSIMFWRDGHDDEVEDCLECRENAVGAASSEQASNSANENTEIVRARTPTNADEAFETPEKPAGKSKGSFTLDDVQDHDFEAPPNTPTKDMVPIRAAERQALEDLTEKDRQNPLTSLPSRVDQQAADLIIWANGHETLTTFACSGSLVIGNAWDYRAGQRDVAYRHEPDDDLHVKAVLKSQTASIEQKYQVNWEQSFYTSMICAGSRATETNAAAHADRLSDFCAKVSPKTIGSSHVNAHMRMWNFLTKARQNGWIHLIMLKQPIFDTYIQRKGAQHTDEEYAAWD